MKTSALYSYLGNERHQISNIRIYVVFGGGFFLRYYLAQLPASAPRNLSNVVIKVLGSRLKQHFYDPTTVL